MAQEVMNQFEGLLLVPELLIDAVNFRVYGYAAIQNAWHDVSRLKAPGP